METTDPKPTKKRGCCLWYVLGAIVAIILVIFLFSQGRLLFQAIVKNDITFSQLKDYYHLIGSSDNNPDIVSSNNSVRSITVQLSTSGTTTKDRVASVISQYPDLFGIPYFASQFQLVDEKTLDNGDLLATFTQRYEGIPVYQSSINVTLNSEGDFISMNGGYIPNFEDIDTQPKLTNEEAFSKLTNKKDYQDAELVSDPELVIYDPIVLAEGNSNPRLAWVMDISNGNSILRCLIDANNGSLIKSTSLSYFSMPEVLFYDAEDHDASWIVKRINSRTIDKLLIHSSSTKFDNDQRALENYFETAYSYFEYKFGFSFEGDDSAAIRIFTNYDGNASFLAISSPDYPGRTYLFNHKYINLEIVTHEFTHSVFLTLLDNNHTEAFEARAVNEGLADSFAAFLDEDDPWTIASDYETIRTIDREMNGQAYHYDDLFNPDKKFGSHSCPNDIDAACSHLNSTIFSHAIYLLTEGGTSEDGKIAVEGIGEDKTAFILYKTMERVTSNVTFMEFRNQAHFMCETYISSNSGLSDPLTDNDCDQVLNAFASVGVGQTAEERRQSVEKKKFPEINFFDFEASFEEFIQSIVDQLSIIIQQELEKQTENFLRMIYEWLLNFIIEFVKFLEQL